MDDANVVFQSPSPVLNSAFPGYQCRGFRRQSPFWAVQAVLAAEHASESGEKSILLETAGGSIALENLGF
jgi:hypothetical protein